MHIVLPKGIEVKRLRLPTGQGKGLVYEISDGGIDNEWFVVPDTPNTTIEYVDHDKNEQIIKISEIKVTRFTIPKNDGLVAVCKVGDGRLDSHTMEKSDIKGTEIVFDAAPDTWNLQ